MVALVCGLDYTTPSIGFPCLQSKLMARLFSLSLFRARRPLESRGRYEWLDLDAFLPASGFRGGASWICWRSTPIVTCTLMFACSSATLEGVYCRSGSRAKFPDVATSLAFTINARRKFSGDSPKKKNIEAQNLPQGPTRPLHASSCYDTQCHCLFAPSQVPRSQSWPVTLDVDESS